MTRETINMDGTTMELIMTLSEGIPGAVVVLAEMIKNEDNWIFLLHLDDMNIRGSQIWVGYKDHCGENLETFIECIKARDSEMIQTINEECYHPEWGEGYTEKAVRDAASWREASAEI